MKVWLVIVALVVVIASLWFAFSGDNTSDGLMNQSINNTNTTGLVVVSDGESWPWWSWLIIGGSLSTAIIIGYAYHKGWFDGPIREEPVPPERALRIVRPLLAKHFNTPFVSEPLFTPGINFRDHRTFLRETTKFLLVEVEVRKTSDPTMRGIHTIMYNLNLGEDYLKEGNREATFLQMTMDHFSRHELRSRHYPLVSREETELQRLEILSDASIPKDVRNMYSKQSERSVQQPMTRREEPVTIVSEEVLE